MTIVVEFPEGIVTSHAPTGLQRLIGDNRSVAVLLLGLLAVFGFYALAWLLVGRDPPDQLVRPVFKPPADVSAAAAHYLWHMGWDQQCLTAGILDLAAGGFIEIEQDERGYVLRRRNNPQPTDMSDEAKILDQHLLNGRDELRVAQGNHAHFQNAAKDLKKLFKNRYLGDYFVNNGRWVAMGAVLSLLAIVAATLWSSAAAIFLLVWLTPWTVVAGAAGWNGAEALRALDIGKFIPMLFTLGIAGAGVGFGMFMLSGVVGPWSIATILAIIIVNLLFFRLLKRPTRRGQDLRSQIKQFREYPCNAPDRPGIAPSSDVFDRYLPYAVALGVEKNWSTQFEHALAGAGTAPQSPAWYHGPYQTFNSFGDGFCSGLSSAISSASTTPGSSGGGGGSSGGGGGGGGGGGW